MFQNYLSYSALAGTDDEAVAGGFNDRSRDDMKVIHAENSLDLGEESRQEPEVSSGHPNEACYYLRNELLVREDNAGRRPSFFKQFLDLRRIERAELTSIAALIFGDTTLRAPRSSLDFRARATSPRFRYRLTHL